MFKTALFVSALSLTLPAYSFEYAMVKGDTLWSLSKRYLKDPYLWPKITYLDGSKVEDPRRMPIGTLLLIPKEIANERAVIELSDEVQTNTQQPTAQSDDKLSAGSASSNESLSDNEDASTLVNETDNNKGADVTNNLSASEQNSNKPYVSNPSLLAIVERLNEKQRNRLWDYWLKHKDGLVRAYYNGQEVVIEAQLLIDEMRHMESKTQ